MLWQDKPYHSLDYFYKHKFHTKIAKLAIDAGFTCPNRDGSISRGGCIFCSSRGSGDFAGSPLVSVTEQLELQKNQIAAKWPSAKYIAYFQAFTNTYASEDQCRAKYEQALHVKDVVGLSIATRPDCIPPNIMALLQEINQKTYLSVELGLQTSNEKTAAIINRGYQNACFEKALYQLTDAGIDIVAHVIIGLPGETKEDVLKTAQYLSFLPIQGVKLHLLHVLKDTPLEQWYSTGKCKTLEKEEYIHILISALEILRPDIVIHRLTGDGAKNSLIAPIWSLNKMDVLNSIQKEMRQSRTWQGKYWTKRFV